MIVEEIEENFSYKIKFDGFRTSDHLVVKSFMDVDFLSFQVNFLILMLGLDPMDLIYYALKFLSIFACSVLTLDHVQSGDVRHVEKPLSNRLGEFLKN